MNYFDNGLGITADSIAYYRGHRHELGTIVAAEISFPGMSDHYPYCFELRDDRGNRMFLSGLTTGYPGEGPRAMEILIDAGFAVVESQRVMVDRQVVLRQATWPPDPLPPMPASLEIFGRSRGRVGESPMSGELGDNGAPGLASFRDQRSRFADGFEGCSDDFELGAEIGLVRIAVHPWRCLSDEVDRSCREPTYARRELP